MSDLFLRQDCKTRKALTALSAKLERLEARVGGLEGQMEETSAKVIDWNSCSWSSFG